MTESPIVEISNLSVVYRGGATALDDVTLSVVHNEIVAIVGESGSGKSTIGRALLGLAPIAHGTIRVSGIDVVPGRDFAGRAKLVQCVFQDPYSSLDPRMSVEAIISEPMLVAREMSRVQVADRTEELLQLVGLSAALASRRPHELSGGQCQRVAIARAVALRPAVLICDEATSSLDVSVQAQIVELFEDLQRTLGIALVFISHDLAVVSQIADRVIVLQGGRIVEQGEISDVFESPKVAYTAELLSAVPQLSQDG